ncbi:MAG: 16S rRNA (guanine(527)-N(7))-methyltransferase RsmG [Planctomycetota bacterium]
MEPGGAPEGRARARLECVARLRGFPADGATLDRLLAYLRAVLEHGRRLNLTAARDLERATDVLALSALAVTRAWPRRRSPPARIVDLGTGNGLPGVAAALAWPGAEVLLVERRGHKARAVASCVRAVGLDGVEVLALDGRELLARRPDLREGVDLVTVRAVGTLAASTRIAAPWLAPGGRVVHWKGRGLVEKEIEAGRAAARVGGLRARPWVECDDEAGPAHLVVYERPRDGLRRGR